MTTVAEHRCAASDVAFAKELAEFLKALAEKHHLSATVAYALVGVILGESAVYNCETVESVNALLNSAFMNMQMSATRTWKVVHGDQDQPAELDGMGRPTGRA